MSYSFNAAGYLEAQRDAEGKFVEGEILPVTVPDGELENVERWNLGARMALDVAYQAARNLIIAQPDFDHEHGKFSILINGHVQDEAKTTADSYCTITVSRI